MLQQIIRNVNLSGLGQSSRALKDKLYKQRIMFIHVPKSGGTSLSHMLRAKYPLSYFKVDEHSSRMAVRDIDNRDWMAFKRSLMAYHAEMGTHYIQAHAPITRDFFDAYKSDYGMITLLRHPVDRMISHYFFDGRLRKMSPEAFLDSKRGYTESHLLAHFFGELDWNNPEDETAAADRAIDMLKQFNCVGILDKQNKFAEDMHAAFGIKMRIPQRNIGAQREDKVFTPELMARIEDMCREDIRIYETFAN